jgi:hypothetical protein
MYDETIKTKDTKIEKEAAGTKTEERVTKQEKKTIVKEEPEKDTVVVIEND